jgi:hypothetical protein
MPHAVHQNSLNSPWLCAILAAVPILLAALAVLLLS